ncbi:hypothetical protein, partial [Micromonospora marina]|uniref:hypothetical protein n=1 Tax=Micromonospora marina TaxID=307120 RepID=UPI003D754F38
TGAHHLVLAARAGLYGRFAAARTMTGGWTGMSRALARKRADGGRWHALIPVLILSGLLLGRWWRSSLVVAALGWPALLVATGVMDVGVGLFGAAVLAVANTGAGVLLHQGDRPAIRRLRAH